jgi:polysaccharide biosynthesis protein PslJ
MASFVAFPSEIGAERRLPTGWPILAAYLLFPVWWVLGLGQFIWPLLAIPMLFWLLVRRNVVFPRGFGLWLGFVAWMLMSAFEVNTADRVVGFGYRAAIYLSATVFLLYVVNAREDELPTKRVVDALAFFWLFVVAGGFAAVLFPTFSFTTPVESILPRSLLSNAYVVAMVHPGFAQVHDFLGYPVPRPAAPFVYTNDWGSNFGILLPFVFVSFVRSRSDVWRLVLLLAGVASLVPVVVSLDRGLWLSAGLGVLYALLRLGASGRGRVLGAAAVLLPMMLLIVWFSPLHQLISDRFAHPHSNTKRLSLAQESVEGVTSSPWFGYGAPRPSTTGGVSPSVGTQGQLWLVMYSHGFPALVLFFGWFVWSWWRMRGTDPPDAFLVHVVLTIALIQVAVYDWLPVQLHTLMIAIALGWRAIDGRARERREAAERGHALDAGVAPSWT